MNNSIITASLGNKLYRPFDLHEADTKFMCRNGILYKVETDEENRITNLVDIGYRVDNNGHLYGVYGKHIPFKLSRNRDKIVHSCSFE